MMMPVMGFIGNLGYVAVCVVGGAMALNGKISFGVIVAFMMYVRYFTQPLCTDCPGSTDHCSPLRLPVNVYSSSLKPKRWKTKTGKIDKPRIM